MLRLFEHLPRLSPLQRVSGFKEPKAAPGNASLALETDTREVTQLGGLIREPSSGAAQARATSPPSPKLCQAWVPDGDCLRVAANPPHDGLPKTVIVVEVDSDTGIRRSRFLGFEV